MHFVRRLQRRARLAHWLLALVAVLLLAQAAGQVHRALHAVPAHDVAVAAFADHAAGDADCRLLDQLLHADLLSAAAPPVTLPAAAPAAASVALRAARLAPLWRQRARGPPLA